MFLTNQYEGLCSKTFRSHLAKEGIVHIYRPTAVDSRFSNGLNHNR